MGLNESLVNEITRILAIQTNFNFNITLLMLTPPCLYLNHKGRQLSNGSIGHAAHKLSALLHATEI